VTIVRPSHTYDRTTIALLGGWTAVDRMRRGLPVIVPGDGTSLRTLTHHADFARAFVSLLGRPQAIGETFHSTGDEAQPWDQIYTTLGARGRRRPLPRAPQLGTDRPDRPALGAALLGDAAHSVIFDNTKIRQHAPGWNATISWADGAREIISWFDADPARRVVSPEAEASLEALAARAPGGALDVTLCP
jgi:nucleoside-diphosphate-sugar epimerase